MSTILRRLTEGIVERDLKQEGAALLSKWSRTGLLEGLEGEYARNNMARLLENQAKELLRETSTMQAGDVEGFASVAFPIVRRVFGGLVANDLVSVQPMSLPSGLIFFLDFVHTDRRYNYDADDSIYGQGRVAGQITGGVDINGNFGENADSFYHLSQGYTSPQLLTSGTAVAAVLTGTVGGSQQTGLDAAVRYDPDLQGSEAVVVSLPVTAGINGQAGLTLEGLLNQDNLQTLILSGATTHGTTTSGVQVRRLTHYSGTATTMHNASRINFVFASSTATAAALLTEVTGANSGEPQFLFASADNFNAGNALGSVVGAAPWALESRATSAEISVDDTIQDIPEIDIKVDSIAVTAITKKLKAKWTPELGQDLNAYHNLDAEVELTSILSEQIALEIDREILNDLIVRSTAAKLYWSRYPGKYLNRETGADITSATAPPDFTGNVSEWYETLIETINDVSARIHRKTLRGGANFLVVGPEVANILEFTAGFRASVTHDVDRGTAGAVKVGSISKKWDIYVDPYFPRNLILVGRKGSSFLESGYVYAPYVPLQVTPTIFGTEDFVPRKGVMTRYAKQMVRPDMYGLVVVQNLV